MPYYEYVCPACKAYACRLENSDAPLEQVCTTPGCLGKLTRKISAPSFNLAGSGWARDGYASSK